MGITPSNNNRQMEELYRRQILQHTERGFAESSVAQSTGSYPTTALMIFTLFNIPSSRKRSFRSKFRLSNFVIYMIWFGMWQMLPTRNGSAFISICYFESRWHPMIILWYPKLVNIQYQTNTSERTTRGSEKNRARSWRYRGVSMHCHLFSLEETFVVSATVTATSSSLSGTGECSSTTPVTSNPSSSITYPQDTEARERTFSWRKIEVIDIRQPHDIRIHFEGLSCAVRTFCYS